MKTLFVGSALAVLFAAVSVGQDTRGKVQGIITDSSNAVIAGAAVSLRNEETGVQAQQQTSQVGQYLFGGMFVFFLYHPQLQPSSTL